MLPSMGVLWLRPSDRMRRLRLMWIFIMGVLVLVTVLVPVPIPLRVRVLPWARWRGMFRGMLRLNYRRILI